MSTQDAVYAALALAEDSHAEGLYEPQDRREADAAVQALIGAYEGIPGSFREGSERTRSSTAAMSDDPLQGISEVIQNADDHGATHVVVSLTPDSLLFEHNGQPGQLANVHALGVPYLTTNRDREDTTGRFGIGLSTLQSLAPHFDFHSGLYHVRVGDPYLTVLPGLKAIRLGTTFRVPLDADVVTTNEFVKWFERWDDAGLMFLANVCQIEFVCETGGRALALTRRPSQASYPGAPEKTFVSAVDGRSWALYSRTIDSPAGIKRLAKKTGMTTTVQVALPIRGASQGHVYAGLPVERLSLPVLINGQFDPMTGRNGFHSSEWNLALAEPIASLWVDAMIDLFKTDAQHAWACVPGREEADETSSSFTGHLATVIRASSPVLARMASAPRAGEFISLTSMHAEVAMLGDVLSSDDIDRLREGPALPQNVRDLDGHWREVWQGWIDDGVPLSPLVSLEEALPLLSEQSKDTEWTVAFHALAISHGFGDVSRHQACLIDAESKHFTPDDEEIGFLTLSESDGLAAALGICRSLSLAYSADTAAAQTVRQWLTEQSYLVDSTDPTILLQQIAAIGNRQDRARINVTDDQLIAIRDALEPLGRDSWQSLGPGIGNAISLRAYSYDSEGTAIPTRVPPSEAYLPKQIEREPLGFHAAAAKTPGLLWAASNYGTLLRSSLGRHGLGVQRFLGVLGCATSPRVTRHRMLQRRYQDRRLGLPLYPQGAPPARSRVLSAMRADFTLDDLESLDLDRVCISIGQESVGPQRRQRARALLAVLSRSWTNEYSEISTVTAAKGYHGWIPRDTVRAFWLWRLGSIPWLDNADGTACAPSDLCIHTDANRALHGPDHPDFLHSDFEDVRSTLLEDIGLAPEPTISELLSKLDDLYDQGNPAEAVFAQALTVYQALSNRLNPQTGGGVDAQAVYDHFRQDRPLINTGSTWVHTNGVFRGSPIFGHLGHFAPEVPGRADRLWNTIGLKPPTANDCVDVLTSIADRLEEPDISAIEIQIDTLRYLASMEEGGRLKRTAHTKLSRLPIWTTKGWVRKRPVYSLSNSLIARSLGATVPVWLPNAEIEQFLPLLKPLAVQSLDDAAIDLLPSTTGIEDEASTDTFRSVIRSMHTDFVLNDAPLAESVLGSWAELETFVVLQCESVSLAATRSSGERFEFAVRAYADRQTKALYVRDPSEIEESDGAALALAALFDAPSRSIVLGWYKALAESRSRAEIDNILLASERQAKALAANTAAAENLANLQAGNGPQAKAKRPSKAATKATAAATVPEPKPRTLNNPAEAKAVSSHGDLRLGENPPVPPVEGNGGGAPPPLKKPRKKFGAGSGASKPKAGQKDYSPEAKEDTGMEYARLALAELGIEIDDIRDQHGVGADAVDTTGTKYFELKVSALDEPTSVVLERSQVQRANADRENFYLVVVSGVECGSPVTRVRIIANPLEVLTMSESTKIRLSDISDDHSSLVLEYSNPVLESDAR